MWGLVAHCLATITLRRTTRAALPRGRQRPPEAAGRRAPTPQPARDGCLHPVTSPKGAAAAAPCCPVSRRSGAELLAPAPARESTAGEPRLVRMPRGAAARPRPSEGLQPRSHPPPRNDAARAPRCPSRRATRGRACTPRRTRRRCCCGTAPAAAPPCSRTAAPRAARRAATSSRPRPPPSQSSWARWCARRGARRA